MLLLHGYPSLWYMWRRQMRALADAGYHAIAPDQRGYGQTGGPDAEDQYTVMHLVGDIIGLLDALGEKQVSHLIAQSNNVIGVCFSITHNSVISRFH